MLIESKQNVDLWEAWIDLQITANEGAATLYLIGDVFTDDRLAQPYFIKREHNNPKILALEILPGITSEDGYITEVMYAEELNELNQYTAIFVYAGGELVARIQDIEQLS